MDEHARRLADSLGSMPPTIDPLLALASNAVEIVASVRGHSAPVLPLEPVRLPPTMTDLLAQEATWLANASDDEVVAYLPTLARTFAATDVSRAREHLSSAALTEVISTVVATRLPESTHEPLSVYDPAAGTGNLLLDVASRAGNDHVRIAGQEVSPSTASFAIANAFLAGVEARFVVEDSLARDGFPGEAFDIIVADPPYGMSWPHGEALRGDPRYPGGLPQRSDSSLLFAQIIASKLRPSARGGGRAVMLCAPSALLSPAGSHIRNWLLENDLVEALIALPEGLSAVTSIRLYALVLNNAKPPAWEGRIQAVDLRGSYVDAPKSRPENRRLSEEGLAELQRSIARLKPTAVARPVTLEHFRFDTVEVRHAAVSVRREKKQAVTRALLPRNHALDEWCEDRYAKERLPEVSVLDKQPLVRLDLSTVFPDPLDREVSFELRRLDWPVSRLLNASSLFAYVLSVKAADRDQVLAALPLGSRYVALPVEAHLDAVVIDSVEAVPDSRCFIVGLAADAGLDSEFVVAWLNSPAGRLVRRMSLAKSGTGSRVNSPRSLSSAAVATYLDEVLLPVPPPRIQRELVDTTRTIAAAERTVASAARTLWQDPGSHNFDTLRRRVEMPYEKEGLADWARRLPYPLAGALWVYETEKDNPIRAQSHLLRFWEATAEFLGAVLLSALDGDPVLRASEFRMLRGALSKAGLSLERASFGTWGSVVQRLTSTFRTQLTAEEPDSGEKILQLFGDPPEETLSALLDSGLGRLLARVNTLRNDWLGHAGATTDSQAREQLQTLVGHTEELRDRMSSVWDQYRLVRAGRMAHRQGSFYVNVEVAIGPATPFRQVEIRLAEPLEEGRLYLTPVDGDRSLLLNELILLKQAPRSANYTSYFYSRREALGFRLVAYQYAEESSVVEEVPGIDRLLREFASDQDRQR